MLYFTAWTTITSDKKILSDIKGVDVELSEIHKYNTRRNAQLSFTCTEAE